MFLTYAWSGTPTIVGTARLTSTVRLMAGPDGSAQTNLCNKRPFPVKSFTTMHEHAQWREMKFNS